MRMRAVSSLVVALGLTLGLAACDARPPMPPFAKSDAPPAAAPTDPASAPAPQDQVLSQTVNCCACPPAEATCPDARPAPATPVASKPAARPHPARRHAAYEGAGSGSAVGREREYRRYQGPDIATQGGYQARAESYQGHYQDQYRGEAYREERYAYAPPPPPQAHSYGEQHQSYSEHRSYSQQSSGYGHAVAAGPCCAGRPTEAAGRDSGGYLTWPGKRPPAPYY